MGHNKNSSGNKNTSASPINTPSFLKLCEEKYNMLKERMSEHSFSQLLVKGGLEIHENIDWYKNSQSRSITPVHAAQIIYGENAAQGNSDAEIIHILVACHDLHEESKTYKSSCKSKKTTYRLQKYAEEEIIRIASMPDDGRKKPVRAYKCNMCPGWHITSDPTPKSNGSQSNAPKAVSLNFESIVSKIKDRIKKLDEMSTRFNSILSDLNDLHKDLDNIMKADRKQLSENKTLNKLREQNILQKKQIVRLQKDSNDLINKNLQLEKKIAAMQTKTSK